MTTNSRQFTTTTTLSEVDLRRQKAVQYYHDNKEKITAQRKAMVSCECGRKFQHVQLSRHNKSKPHKDFLEKCYNNNC